MEKKYVNCYSSDGEKRPQSATTKVTLATMAKLNEGGTSPGYARLKINDGLMMIWVCFWGRLTKERSNQPGVRM